MPFWLYTIPGKPQQADRGRAVVRGGRPAIVKAQAYRDWTDRLQPVVARAWSRPPLDEPVELRLRFLFERPRSKTWKTKPMPRYPHTARPDVDNLAKAVQDLLERAGVLRNDSRVARLIVDKQVCDGTEPPSTSVMLRWGVEAGL